MPIFDSEIPLFSLKMPYDFVPVPSHLPPFREPVQSDPEDIGAPAGLAVVEGTTLRKSWEKVVGVWFSKSFKLIETRVYRTYVY